MTKKKYAPEQIINRLREELLNREIFMTIEETLVLIEKWRREYNQVRPLGDSILLYLRWI